MEGSLRCRAGVVELVPLYGTISSPGRTATSPPWLIKNGKLPARLQIQEMAASPHNASINVVQIRNRSKTAWLLPAGTLLRGGYQNRVLMQTMIIPGRDTIIYASVLCTEKGRWEGRTNKFNSWKAPDAGILDALCRDGRQAGFWKYADQQFRQADTILSTSDLNALIKAPSVPDSRLKLCLQTWKQVSGKSLKGWAVYSNGHLWMSEIFSSAETADLMLPLRAGIYMNAHPSGVLPPFLWPPSASFQQIWRAGPHHHITTYHLP